MFGAIGNPDHDDCVRMVDVALENGINFIDTADMYSAGESEEIVGKALRGRRDGIVLATKAHIQMGEGRNRSGNSRRWIMQAVEASLRRLQTDWIDLFQIHRPDPSTDIEVTLSALTDLVHQGKIRAFGCSTFPAGDIVEAYLRCRTPRSRALQHRATSVLAAVTGHRRVGPAALPAVADESSDLESACLGVSRADIARESRWTWQPVGPRSTRRVLILRTQTLRRSSTLSNNSSTSLRA